MTENRRRLERAWTRHERRWKENRYVYAVVSRRSGGVSVGINLNPDKSCNFDCIYCQVDRRTPPSFRRVDLEMLSAELDRVLEAGRDGTLYDSQPFDSLPVEHRGIRDIAFSGDGEPTTFPRFTDAVRIAAAARERFALNSAKIVLITDAAYLQKTGVREGLTILDRNGGEVWAKLDAGTEEHFRRVCRPNVPFQTILDNILETAIVRPIVIQSLWMRIEGSGPDRGEISAYCRRINTILEGGGRLRNIQIYTVARCPAESSVEMLPDSELDSIAEAVRRNVPVPVETYYGVPQTPGSVTNAKFDA
jgi:wyosine [tRNA(Phe)-imidazoG37] synthetase (radical SAM superfamily)